VSRRRSPLLLLTLARVRLFFREPGAVFWAFGFPLLMSLALGVAFRNRPPEPINVAVEDAPGAQAVYDALTARPDVHARLLSHEDAALALRTGKVALVVSGVSPAVYVFDRMRPDSRVARAVVDDVLQRAAGRKDAVPVTEREVSEQGARYIDFLVPGLIGMNIMSSGMWGIGYAIVEERTRRLLKRLVATPMRRGHFLLSFMLMRVVFLLVELPVILLFTHFVFGVTIQGSVPLFVALAFLGAFTFSGVGLLVASRAQNTQTAGGLMNLVMLPMFLLSGVFFSSGNFPDAAQPFIKLLPLTALNDSLRAVMNDGAGIQGVMMQVVVLSVIATISFGLALKLFRWQ
jgi:ABC-2 type transport system permease protein